MRNASPHPYLTDAKVGPSTRPWYARCDRPKAGSSDVLPNLPDEEPQAESGDRLRSS